METRTVPGAAVPGSDRLDALVVLGCRVQDGRPSRALESRLQLALQLAQNAPPVLAESASLAAPIVLSGGRLWSGQREADVMAQWLTTRGIPSQALILERDSLTTQQNARKVAALLSTRGWNRIGLVTSDFHMQRAVRLFRREGAWVKPLPARSELGFLTEKRLALRELCALVWGRFEPR